ncbi:MAG: hypothetical protein CMN30_00870 [Sandaracinus sp.]|nr:hypothetical protein [Sandaracinus sp.]
MPLIPLQPPPADPVIARRLLDTTVYVPPPRSALDPVEPWTVFEVRVAVHAANPDVLRFALTPPALRDQEERILRTSGAPWERPSELPSAILAAVRLRLTDWERRTGSGYDGAHVLVRAEHGYRLTFRTSVEQHVVELAVTPPRIIDERIVSIPRRSMLDVVRDVGRRSITRIAGGEPSSVDRVSVGG